MEAGNLAAAPLPACWVCASLVYALGIRQLLPRQLRDLEAMLPHLPQRPLRQILPEVTPAQGETRHRVGFFLGCAQSLMFAEESAATVRVLARNGCTVITPKDTVCCGMPAAGYGRNDLAQRQARINIALFEKADVGCDRHRLRHLRLDAQGIW